MPKQQSAAPMASERKPITPEIFASLRVVSDPTISPDGKRVAYTLAEWAPGEQRRRVSVWVVSAEQTSDGRLPEPTLVAAVGKHDSQARWSPDGQWLAFLSNREEEGGFGKAQVYVAPAAGGAARRVCAMPNGAGALAWSPDSQRLAFTTL
ncbi:MAG TPA: hypothetical protein VF725_16340, partial [Ktedonobacterales bacterium]